MGAISKHTGVLTRLLATAKHARVERGVDRTQIRLVLPEDGSQSLGPLGAEAVPTVVALFSVTRQKAWAAGYLDMGRLRQTGHTFITAQRYRFYNPKDKQPEHTVSKNTWTVDMILRYTGDTSFYTRASLRGDTGLRIDSDTSWVYADKDTRKKEKIPEWFRKEFYPSSDMKPDRISLPKVKWTPEKPKLQRKVISPGDIDHFGHANHSQYIELSVQSLQEVQKGHDIPDQHLLNDSSWLLSQVDLVFLGESRTGDELEIGTVAMEDDLRTKKYLCQIRNAYSKKMISQVQFVFNRDARLNSNL